MTWSPCTRRRGQGMPSAARRSWRPSPRSPGPQVWHIQVADLSTCAPGSVAEQNPLHGAGIILDGVYGGKAFHAFKTDVQASPDEWRDRRILFLHTGGLFGVYAEAEALQRVLDDRAPTVAPYVQA